MEWKALEMEHFFRLRKVNLSHLAREGLANMFIGLG